MVDAGENVSETVKREFTEEAGNFISDKEQKAFKAQIDKLFKSGKVVYQGYVDDPRNTDNAWMETTAFHFHCEEEFGELLKLKAGSDAASVKWLNVDDLNGEYNTLYASHKELVDKVKCSCWPEHTGNIKGVIADAKGKAKSIAEGAAKTIQSTTKIVLDNTPSDLLVFFKDLAKKKAGRKATSDALQVTIEQKKVKNLAEKRKIESEILALTVASKIPGDLYDKAVASANEANGKALATIKSTYENAVSKAENDKKASILKAEEAKNKALVSAEDAKLKKIMKDQEDSKIKNAKLESIQTNIKTEEDKEKYEKQLLKLEQDIEDLVLESWDPTKTSTKTTEYSEDEIKALTSARQKFQEWEAAKKNKSKDREYIKQFGQQLLEPPPSSS